MQILFIGGTLFMGRETVEQMVARGHDVSVLHRRDHNDFGAGVVRNIQADRGDLDAMARILGSGRFAAVFDFAYDWEHGTAPAQVEAAARSCGSGLERYVFISSVAAYGEGVNLAEDASLAPDYPMPYIQHKATSEHALFAMHRASGFPVTTLRPPFVHGPRQPFYREQFFWDRMLDMQPLTSVVDKAARVLGFEPTPLDEALRVSFAWYREQPRRPVDYTFEDRLLAAA